MCSLMGLFITSFGATLKTAHFQNLWKLLVPTKLLCKFFYCNINFYIWFYQTEWLKTYKRVLKIICNQLIRISLQLSIVSHNLNCS